MRKRRKLKKQGLFVFVGLIVILAIFLYSLKQDKDINLLKGITKTIDEEITDFENISYLRASEYAKEKKLELDVFYDYNDSISKNKIIEGHVEGNKLTLVVSLGSLPIDEFKKNKVNELGRVPIMMYHGIVDTTTNQYTGGNVDKDGYNRTSNAFLEDLEMYYGKGYRMIRLKDYIDGNIDVSLGYSPIILTFDDGNANNFRVIKKNEDGSLEFDPNSAIGVLEKIKKKYPDFNVTATFFLNGGLCNQPEYNEDIIKFLLENGYDIGNHTISHVDFTKISIYKTKEEVGNMYKKLENLIPGKYVNIIALPFGSPYSKGHKNYEFILNGEYDGFKYNTEAALRVGWEPEVSPFDTSFDKTFLKRVRAYDNNGREFDLEMTFKLLEKTRYISDGNKDIIVIPKSSENKLIETDKKIVTYEE